jgi:hypothetical protein
MIPSIVGALILLTYTLRLLNPYRPQWTKPFLRETKAETDELDIAPRHQFALATYALLAIASFGLIQQICSVYFPVVIATFSFFPSLAWVSVLSGLLPNMLTLPRLLQSQSLCCSDQDRLRCLCFSCSPPSYLQNWQSCFRNSEVSNSLLVQSLRLRGSLLSSTCRCGTRVFPRKISALSTARPP